MELVVSFRVELGLFLLRLEGSVRLTNRNILAGGELKLFRVFGWCIGAPGSEGRIS